MSIPIDENITLKTVLGSQTALNNGGDAMGKKVAVVGHMAHGKTSLAAAIAKLRKEAAESIAQEIASVQPMPDALTELFKGSKSETELIEQGYEPVDPVTRLLWRKK